MLWTDDPVADYDRYDAQVQSELDRLPKCSECGNPIQEEECWEFNNKLICEGCLTDNHRKWVEDYVK